MKPRIVEAFHETRDLGAAPGIAGRGRAEQLGAHVPVAEAVERVFAAEDRGKDGRCTSCRRAVTQGHVAARRSENGSMARIASKSPALAVAT